MKIHNPTEICIVRNVGTLVHMPALISTDDDETRVFMISSDSDPLELCLSNNAFSKNYEVTHQLYSFATEAPRLKKSIESLKVDDKYTISLDVSDVTEMADEDFEYVHPDIRFDAGCGTDISNVRISHTWISYGNIIMPDENNHRQISYFQAAAEFAQALNSALNKPQTPKETEMKNTVIEKASSAVATAAQVNKNALNVVAQISAGSTVLQIAINRIEQIVPEKNLELFKAYSATPIGKYAIANMFAMAQSQFLAGNAKAEYIARGAVMAGMQEIVAALPIQQMIVDLFSGVEVNLPE